MWRYSTFNYLKTSFADFVFGKTLVLAKKMYMFCNVQPADIQLSCFAD